MADGHVLIDEENFEVMTVKDLKKYLRERNQKVTGVKSELVARAKGAFMLRLNSSESVSVSQQSSGEQIKVSKLTTRGGIQLPDPCTLKGWSDDMTLVPSFTEKEIYNYLVLSTHRSADSRPMKAIRQLKAAVFYDDGHVHSIGVHTISEDCDHMFVKCLVIPSFPTSDKKNNPDHQVWVCLSKVTGHVNSAFCTCVAGAGEACNHVSALLYAMEDITRKKETGQISCTSTKCTWIIPRDRKMPPQTADNLNLMSSGRKSMLKRKRLDCTDSSSIKEPDNDGYNEECDRSPHAMNTDMPVSNINIDRFREKLLQNENKRKCGFIVATTPAIDQPPVPMNEPNLPRLPDVEFCFHDSVNISSSACQETFAHHVENITVTKEEATQIEHLTRGQHKKESWKEARTGRITSSNFGRVFSLRESTQPDKLVHHVLAYGPQLSTVHTRWGTSHEPAARRSYVRHMSKHHPGLCVKQCGLIVSPKYPYLGASPDGLVSCDCHSCGNGLLEIKCPSILRNCSPEEAATQTNFFCELDEHKNLKLKENHPYYFQVQGQMAVTNRKWCDFVVWTLKGISIQRISFNERIWIEMFQKLKFFYVTAIVPELFCRRVQRGRKLYTTSS